MANDNTASKRVKPREPNYDESKAPPFTLPDPLVFADGRPVASPADWPARRREILDIFAREMYGREPPPPEAFEFKLCEEGETLGGLGIRRQYRIWFKADRSGPYLDWLVILPNRIAGTEPQKVEGGLACENPSPVPVVLYLNYHGNHALLNDPQVSIPANVWMRLDESRRDGSFALRPGMRAYDRNTHDRRTFPVEVLLARGYAVMSCCYGQVSPDVEVPRYGDALSWAWRGVFALWPDNDPAAPDRTTALGAWGWALSRGLDLAERIPEIDARRAVVTGSSRLGKAALVAGARDERFAVVVPNQTGGGGTPLAKHIFGETIGTETLSFPHWYCPAYSRYADKEEDLPFDQHMFLACVAPRALLVQGYNSGWFDARGEYLACRAASPVWKLLGDSGLPEGDFPDSFDTSLIGKRLGYVRRGGEHGISAYDWLWTLDFADGVFASGR